MSLGGGVVADRFDKRRIVLVTSALSATLLGLLAVLDLSGTVRVWHVLAIAAVSSLITGVEWPTRQALFPHLIERDGLMSAVALNSVLWQSTRMVMPALGGILIAATSTGILFTLAAIGYLVMWWALWRIPVSLPGSRGASALTQIREGIGFIAGHELFRWLILLSYSAMFFASAYMQLMPAFATLLGVGGKGYGLLLSATGVGSIAGTLVIGALQRVPALGRLLLGAAAAAGALIAGFAAVSAWGWYPAALGTAFASSLCVSVFMVSAMTVMQLEVPDALRGRVMGIHSITYSLMPLGGLLLGAIAQQTSIVVAVQCGAAVFVLITALIALARPAIRGIDGQALAVR